MCPLSGLQWVADAYTLVVASFLMLAGSMADRFGRAHGADFAQATHPMWWIMAGCGAMVGLLGWFSNTPWAQASTRPIADLLADPVSMKRGLGAQGRRP